SPFTWRGGSPDARGLPRGQRVARCRTGGRLHDGGQNPAGRFRRLSPSDTEVAPALSPHPPRGCRGLYGRQLTAALGSVSRNVRTCIMSSQCVTLINHERQVVATAHVAEQRGQFIGRVDCSLMPLPLQRLFTEYEELVSTQVFS